jgi:hypothetical protein
MAATPRPKKGRAARPRSAVPSPPVLGTDGPVLAPRTPAFAVGSAAVDGDGDTQPVAVNAQTGSMTLVDVTLDVVVVDVVVGLVAATMTNIVGRARTARTIFCHCMSATSCLSERRAEAYRLKARGARPPAS